MASSDAKPVPTKNTAFRLTFDGRKNDGSLITTGTGMDTELSGDAGAFADATNEATEIATNSGVYHVDLTAAEMNFDTVCVKTTWTNLNAIPTVIVLYPAENADIPVNVTAISGDTTAADNAEADYDGTGYNKSASAIGTTAAVTTVNGLAAGVITAAAIAADAITDAKVAADVTIASVTGAVGSVTGNVGGNVAGTVASVTGNVVGSIGSLAAQAKADVNAEVDTALADVGLTTTITGRIDAAVSTRATPAQVNTEVLDVLVTDTFAELAAVPASTSSLKDKINWLFALARNKMTQTVSTQTLRNDADGANIATAAVSDADGTTTRGEWS